MRRGLLVALGLLVVVAAAEAAHRNPSGYRSAASSAAFAASSQAAQPTPSVDFDYYRTQIEPIFLKPRDPGQGAGRPCASCHTTVTSRLRLQRLPPGATSWTEEQSQQNFQLAAALVTPGEPLQSRLLLHPLSTEAGGDPTHTGGKFWQSQNDPEWQTLATWVSGARGANAGASTARTVAAAAPSSDYEVFKARVQPIFLLRRPGHARCYACHALGAGEGNAPNAMRLQHLSPGSATWDEEQSRKNFDAVRAKVTPGNPLASPLLIHPLRYEAGGDQWHGGGAQFMSANDPEWQTIAAWVRGEKPGTATDR